MDNIILIGMPGSGKSTVGVLLAKTLGYRFLDADLLIQQREGALLQDILDQFGVKHFLQVEEEAIRTVDCRRTVIAPGGSAVWWCTSTCPWRSWSGASATSLPGVLPWSPDRHWPTCTLSGSLSTASTPT